MCICLAGIELPELLTLTNNTSNDFTTFLTSSKTSAAVQIHFADLPQKNARAAIFHPCCAYYCFATALDTITPRSPRDLLALHSFWQT